MVATSNVALHTGVLFQLLAGVIYAGNPQAQIIMQAFATNFQSQADNYIADQKLAHYAKLPPRAVFRSQIIAVFINCFLFIAMLNWMVGNFNRGTLCTWDNEQRFVCAVAVAYVRCHGEKTGLNDADVHSTPRQCSMVSACLEILQIVLIFRLLVSATCSSCTLSSPGAF